MFDVITIDFSRFSSGIARRTTGARDVSPRVQHGRGRRAAGRRMRRACRDSGGAVFEQPVREGQRVALALPFCLGIGMAVPWPIAGAGLAALPKPGAWMVRVKQVFGVADPRDGRVLRLRSLRPVREPLGRRHRGRVERRGEGEGGLARRRLPKGSPPRARTASRCSSTCGPPGARTA